jgi:hypothetical protein
MDIEERRKLPNRAGFIERGVETNPACQILLLEPNGTKPVWSMAVSD